MKLKTLGAAALAAAAFLAWAAPDPSTPDVSPDTALNRNLTIFNAITRQVAEAYVDSLRPDDAFDLAISGLLYTVDPYTEYFKEEEVENLEVMTTGAYGGIGSYILGYDGNTYIDIPSEGSPAQKAGLKGGDRILRVDSVDVVGKPSDFTSRHLRGDPGTMVTVVVERPYVTDSILTFNIMRERVQNNSVSFAGVVDGVGYVRLNSFQEQSADEVKKALESFRKDPELKGVVLDLRNNGGGLVTSAVDILGMFLPRNTKVLEMKSKNGNADKVYTTSRSPILPDIPLVVMINEGSASASEITAGAIQDLDRGVLVGRRSFGKGLVQSTLELPYNGILKVTTAKYHLPSGRLIQALDYSNRRPDGTVAPMPDSLTNEFKTLHGRKVRDGGGLVPDTVVKQKDYSRLVYNIVGSNQMFEFANRYAATHPQIPAPGEFVVTDEILDDFIASLDTARVKGDDSGKRLLEQLQTTAETEGFMTDELKAQIEAMTPLVEPDLNRDLYNRREDVELFLGEEIVSRYYGRAGEQEFSLRYDPEFAVAREIILNPDLYRSILGR